MTRRAAFLLLLLTIPASRVHAQTTTAHTAIGVAQALARYDSAFRRQDPGAIAAFFLPDGALGSVGHPPVVGPDSIAARLRMFAQYRLLASTLSADSTRLLADSAALFGHYWQRVRLPGGDTVEAHGLFTMSWVWTATAGWRLRRMITDP